MVYTLYLNENKCSHGYSSPSTKATPSHTGLQSIVRSIIGFVLHIPWHKYWLEFNNSVPAGIQTQIGYATIVLHFTDYIFVIELLTLSYNCLIRVLNMSWRCLEDVLPCFHVSVAAWCWGTWGWGRSCLDRRGSFNYRSHSWYLSKRTKTKTNFKFYKYMFLLMKLFECC